MTAEVRLRPDTSVSISLICCGRVCVCPVMDGELYRAGLESDRTVSRLSP